MAATSILKPLRLAAIWLVFMTAATSDNLLVAETTSALRLKAASYNIHGAIGSDRRYDIKRVARVLKVAAPDVVGLNEVYHDSSANPQHQQLASELGGDWQAFFGKTIDKPNAEYGNAILTRLPVESTETWLLDEWPRQERRGLIRVTVRKNNQRIHVFCTHMGLASTMREKNAQQLIQILDQFDDADQVLLGDFNEVPPAPGLDLLAKSGYTDTWETFGLGPGKTFPARPALRRLDYIWTTGGLAAESVYVGTFPEAKVASDHRPVFASIVSNPRHHDNPNPSLHPGEVIVFEDLEKVPATQRPAWWKQLKNVRARGDSQGQGAVQVVGTEHFWRQKSDGELVFGEEKSRLPAPDQTDNENHSVLLLSIRVQMISPGAGWQISYGDVAMRVRHDRGDLPTLDLLQNGNVITSEKMWTLHADPYVWNVYSILMEPSGSVTILINGINALHHHDQRDSGTETTAGFRLTTTGGSGECEILADDLVLRRIDPQNLDAARQQLQQVPPKIIRATGSRPPTRWWKNLW